MGAYWTLVFTMEFMEGLTHLSTAYQRRILRALEQLDTDEQRLALQIHQLQGQQAGIWTAYVKEPAYHLSAAGQWVQRVGWM